MDAVTQNLPRAPIPPTKRAKDRKAHGRSKITNHRDLLPNVDGNSSQARRFKDLVRAFIADMGGLEMCSEIKINLARRLASTTVLSEHIESRMIQGEHVDVGMLCTLANTCMRLSARLGLERVAKPLPGLHDEGGLLDQIAIVEHDVIVESDLEASDG
jgi:hypothetical protein